MPPFDYQAHNRRMVAHFIWLETWDLDYAVAALEAYRRHPDSPNPRILADVKAEKARRAAASSQQPPLSPAQTPAA